MTGSSCESVRLCKDSLRSAAVAHSLFPSGICSLCEFELNFNFWGCQVVDLENAADSEEAADLDRLLQCIQAEIDTGRSFEYVQVTAAPAYCT